MMAEACIGMAKHNFRASSLRNTGSRALRYDRGQETTCGGVAAWVAWAVFCSLPHAARGQVSVSYDPTRITAGVATDVAISVTNHGASELAITGIVFAFDAPPGLTLNAFRWSNGFDEEPNWVHEESLPDPQAASFDLGIVVAPAATLEIGAMTMTGADVDEPMSVGLTVFAAGDPGVGLFEGGELATVEIVDGREVMIVVEPGEGGSESGGGAGPGSGAGGGENDGPGQGDGGEIEGPEADDGNMTLDDGNGDDVSPPGDGDTVVDGSEDDAGDDPSSGNETGNGDASGDDASTTDDGAEANESNAGSGGLCGFAMVPYALFTLVSLSVMKLANRPRT